MKNNYDGKVKGHGYFRKTKAFGLASGIVLGAALIFGAGSVSADEVNTPATATTTSTSQEDNINFENRQEVNKIINNQTPSNTPDADGTLNSQIKSVETIPATTAGATRYKVELHDGYTTGDDGKLIFYVNNSDISKVTDAIKDKNSGEILGWLKVSKVGVDEQNKITNELNNASTFKEFSDIIKQTPNNKITGLGKVTISLSKAFAEKNKNRVIEFELYNPYGENPRSLSSLLNKDFKPLNALANDAKNATEVLKNTFSAPEFSGPKTIAGVNSRVERGALILPSVNNQKLSGPASYLGVYLHEVNKMVPHELAINVLTSSVQKEPSNTPNIKGLRSISIGFPASIASLGETYEKGYPSNLLGAQEEGKTFIKKGDEINFSLTEDSILKFSSTLKPGDELEFVLETEKDGNGAGGTRFTDSNVFVNADGKTVNLPEKNVKFKVTSVGEKSISLSSMEDVTVKAGHRYTLTPTNVLSYTDLYFNDNWANSKFGNKLVELFKNKDAGAYTQLDPKDHPEIAIRLSYLRDGKVISSNVPYSEVKKDVNSIIGENSTGTVKVRYVDEAGKEIPGQKVETIAENQPWTNTVTITPKSIDGYTFVSSSVPLKTLVGSGEQIITLTYRKLEPVDPNAGKPIVDTIIKEYKPNPKLDPGTQNIVDPGKPRKTQGDKVVDPGKPQVIEVGTKPKVVEEEIPFEKKTRENPNLPEGTSKVVQEGKNGKKKTTTTYTLDPKTGKVTPNTPTVETTPPVDQITEIGKGKDKDGDLVVNYIPDPESPQGNETIVDEGKKPKLDVTGKVKDPGKPKVIKVGTKPKVTEEEIPFEKKTRENPNLPEGASKVVQEGKNGKKKTTTTYTLDPKTGKVTPNTPTVETTPPVDQITEIGKGKDKDGDLVVNYIPDPESPQGNETVVDEGKKPKLDVTGKVKDPGKPKVIKVGTKPKVVEEEIPFKETVVENPSKPEGSRTVLKEGKVGKKTTTTTYTLDPKTGKVTPNTTTSTVPPEDRLIEVGTGNNVNGDIVTEYVPDLELEPGQTKVVQNGTPEVKDVTGKVVTPGTPTIIHIGIKPKVVEENVPFEREYKDNPKLPEGVENVIQKGVNGKKVTTTTYTVDTKTGKVTSTDKVDETPVVNEIVERGTGKNITGEIVVNYVPDPELEPGKTKVVQNGTPEVKDVTGKVVTPGKPTIIHVGTKPKVVEEETPFKEETRENKDLPKGQTKVVQEGKVGKKTTTTTYEVDPKTGTVTPTEKVEETPAVNKITEIGTKEEAKPAPTPTSQTPSKSQVQEVKKQLPSTGTATSVALTLAGLSVMGLATTMVLKKKEN